jgi:outer membrane protein
MLRHLKLTTASLAIAALMSASALAVPGEDGPDGSDDGFEDPRTEETAPQPAPQPQPEPEPEPIDRTPAPAEPTEAACIDSWLGCRPDNPWLIRLRGIGVVPDDGTLVDAVGGVANITNAAGPELDFTYFITERIGIEAIAGTFRHEVAVESVSDGVVIQDLGDLWMLPPAVTATYRWNPRGEFQPYVGVGAQAVIVWDVNNPPGLDVDYDVAVGPTFQIGADFFVTDNLLVNVDLKRSIMDIGVEIEPVGLETDVDLDPWVAGFGIGWKF